MRGEEVFLLFCSVFRGFFSSLAIILLVKEGEERGCSAGVGLFTLCDVFHERRRVVTYFVMWFSIILMSVNCMKND